MNQMHTTQPVAAGSESGANDKTIRPDAPASAVAAGSESGANDKGRACQLGSSAVAVGSETGLTTRIKARNLTQSELMRCAHYDPITGKWTALIKRGKCTIGKRMGGIANGYRLIWIDYTAYRSSRLAWLYMTGSFPPVGMLIDHKNSIRDDDRWCNLRLATYQQNARNRLPGKSNKSGIVGVCAGSKPGTWQANITVDNRTKMFERRDCLELAIADRRKAEKFYFGAFAPQSNDGSAAGAGVA